MTTSFSSVTTTLARHTGQRSEVGYSTCVAILNRWQNTHCRSRLSSGAPGFGRMGLATRVGAVLTFRGRPAAGPPEDSSMAQSVYDEIYARSMRDPAGFWAAAAEDIHWDRRWDRVFDDSRRPFY